MRENVQRNQAIYFGSIGLVCRSGIPSAMAAGILLMAAACGTSYDNVANLDAPGTTVVCFGDSITRGYGATPGGDYPARLSRLLGVSVVNAGRDGDTTASGLARLDRDVLALRPRLVIVGLGGNDLLRRTPREETFSNLDRIVGACVENGAMVVVVHGRFGVWSDPFLEGYREVADRHGAVLVENVLKGILANPKRMSDQIHPNDEGYAVLAERIADVVRPLLAAADARRSVG